MAGKYTLAQKRASAKYMKNSVDRLEIRVNKGGKEIIRKHAEQQGESMNAFINRAIDEQIKRDNEERDGH